jgi:type III secretion protein Q
MHPTRIDGVTGALLRKVGHGRRRVFDGGALALRFCRAGGDGLVLSVRVGNNESAQFWVDAQQWCQWIEPILVVRDWQSVPTELREILAVWTCSSIDPDLDGTGFTWCQAHAIERGECEMEQAWSLRLERSDASLDMRVIHAPDLWLDGLANRLGPMSSTTNDGNANAVIRTPLVAGWSSVTPSALKLIQPGDALVLQRAYAVLDGELTLFTDRPLATVTQCRTGPYTIGLVMDISDDCFAVDTHSIQDTSLASIRDGACVRVIAQVATIDVPLAQLANLQPGDILDGPAQDDGLITLQVAGKPFARGTLLEIGGRLAVKIEHLM